MITEIDDSLSQTEFVEIVHTLPRYTSSLDPFPEDSVASKEREIIHSNRVKLTDYIHDSTVLFPYMKQHGVFSVYDCDVIKGRDINYIQLTRIETKVN